MFTPETLPSVHSTLKLNTETARPCEQPNIVFGRERDTPVWAVATPRFGRFCRPNVLQGVATTQTECVVSGACVRNDALYGRVLESALGAHRTGCSASQKGERQARTASFQHTEQHPMVSRFLALQQKYFTLRARFLRLPAH